MEELLPKTGYRTRIENAVKHDPSHPLNNGVKMQAHHLVSAKGVQLASLGNDLKQLGYDINVLENLVLLPYTLQAACHMRVQVHRGDHKDSDKEHPFTYHERVKRELAVLKKTIDDCKGCTNAALAESNRKRLQAEVNQKSKKMLVLIEKNRIKLSRISKDFDEGEPGCMGRRALGDKPLHTCPYDRNHNDDASAGFKTALSTHYALKVGR